jgi:hypothetical protein
VHNSVRKAQESRKIMDASEARSRDLARGTPIFALGGEQLGTVGKDGVLGEYLIMQAGRLFRHDVSVPVSAIQRSDGHGVYLNRTRGEIRDLTLGGWSSLGNRDLNTGMPADGGPDLDDAVPTPLSPDDTAPTAPPPVPDSR